MEKLQPLITHRFWILFGLALLLPFIGWFMAKGEVQASIESRTSAVKQAVSNSTQGSQANKNWTDDLTKVNDILEERFQSASGKLWNDQKSLMIWPKRMRTTMKNRPYRWHKKEEYAKEVSNTRPKYTYQSLYAQLHEDMVNTVNPLRVSDDNKVVGNVKVNPATIHATPIPPQGPPPSWDIIWDAQEDLWLTQNLLEPIRRINGDLRISEVPVRELVMLQLLGGNRDSSDSAGGGSSSSSGNSMMGNSGDDMAGYNGAAGMMGAMGGGGSGYGMGGGGGSTSIPNMGGLDFNPADEFGQPDGASGGGFGGMTGGGGGDPGMMASIGRPGANRSGGATSSASTAEIPSVDRWVDEDDEMPFRTRGFKIHAIVRGDNVQEFLAELMSAQFPVEIVRFHRATYEGTGSPGMGSGMGGMAGAMGGGMGGMMGGMEDDSGGMGMGMSVGSGMGGGGMGMGMSAGGGGGMGMGMSIGGAGGGMGGMSGMMGMGGMGGMSGMMGGSTGTKPDPAKILAYKSMNEQYTAAMSDQLLVRLVVSGLITVYNEPEEEAQALIDVFTGKTPPPGSAPGVDAGVPGEDEESMEDDEGTPESEAGEDAGADADADAGAPGSADAPAEGTDETAEEPAADEGAATDDAADETTDESSAGDGNGVDNGKPADGAAAAPNS